MKTSNQLEAVETLYSVISDDYQNLSINL